MIVSRRHAFPRIHWIGVLPLLLLLVGCNNIWEWTVDSGSYEALMADGREAIQASNYALAEAKFTQAVEMRPESAEARYYLAKSAVLNGDVDVYELVRTMTDGDNGGAGAVFAFGVREANSVYRVNRVVLDNLEPLMARESKTVLIQQCRHRAPDGIGLRVWSRFARFFNISLASSKRL